MNYGSRGTKLIQEQYQYIRVLEGQLDVCGEQIKTRELLIEKQNQTLALLAEALSEKEKNQWKEIPREEQAV